MRPSRFALLVAAIALCWPLAAGAVEPKAEPVKADKAKAGKAAPGQQAKGASPFDALLAKSELVRNLASMLRPFVETCQSEKRYFRKLFCQALTERLKAQHQSRIYHYLAQPTGAGPLVVKYIARPEPKMEIVVRGCLTCKEPLLEREGGDVSKGRFFVFKTPSDIRIRRGKSLYDLGEIDLARYEVVLPKPKIYDPDDEEEVKAKQWTKKKFEADVLPFIRLDQVYQPVAGVTKVGKRFKYGVLNFELLGHRVYDQCSGKVIGSEPASAQLPPDKNDLTCPQNRPKDDTPKVKLPGTLPQALVKKLMDQMQVDLQVCYEQFGKAGDAPTDMVVAPNGKIKSVQVVGALKGTPAAQCIERLMNNVRFPKFSGRDAKLQWPFSLK